MKNCPYCAEQIADDAQSCPFCGRPSPSAAATRSNAFVRAVHVVLWLGAAGGAVLGFAVSLMACAAANGAPQEGAGAAVGCLMAIVPYVVARAFDEIADYRR